MFGPFSFTGARTGAWLSPGLSSCQSKQSLSSACCWGSSARPPPSLLGRLKRPPVAKRQDFSKTVPTQADQSKHTLLQHNTHYKYKSLGPVEHEHSDVHGHTKYIKVQITLHVWEILNTLTWSMSTLRGRKYTMLSDISLARRKISNVPSVKDENCMFKKGNFQIKQMWLC